MLNTPCTQFSDCRSLIDLSVRETHRVANVFELAVFYRCERCRWAYQGQYVSFIVQTRTVTLTQNSVETCLGPSVKVIFAQFRSLCLKLPHSMHPYFLCLRVGLHLFSERLVYWSQDISDRLSSVCNEELPLSSVLAADRHCSQPFTHEQIYCFLMQVWFPVNELMAGLLQLLNRMLQRPTHWGSRAGIS